MGNIAMIRFFYIYRRFADGPNLLILWCLRGSYFIFWCLIWRWFKFVDILMVDIAMIRICRYFDGWCGDDPNLLMFYDQHGDDPNWLIFWCLIWRQLFVRRLMEFTSRGRRATKEQGSPPHKTNTIQNLFFQDRLHFIRLGGNQRIGQQIYLFSNQNSQ